jgi:hypothetical protein
MPDTYRHIIESSRVFKTKDGNNAQEVIVVDNLTAGTDDKLIQQAMTQGGVPQVGDFHPWLGNCTVSSVEGKPLSTTAVRLWVSYEPPQVPGLPQGGINMKWLVEEDTAVIQVQTQIDREGKPIQVVYMTPTEKPYKRTIACSQFVPLTTLRASKILTTRPPRAWKLAVGKVNSGPFWDETEKGRFLCMGAKASTNDLGRTFHVQATFLGNPVFGWASEAIIVLPTGDKVDLKPADTAKVRDGKYTALKNLNGIGRFLLYGEADLRSIFNLPFDTN